MDQTTPTLEVTQRNHLRFQCTFNLHTRCTVSERQCVKGDRVENPWPRFALLSPVKIRECGQNARVRVSSSAEDPTSDIFGEGLLRVLED